MNYGSNEHLSVKQKSLVSDHRVSDPRGRRDFKDSSGATRALRPEMKAITR